MIYIVKGLSQLSCDSRVTNGCTTKRFSTIKKLFIENPRIKRSSDDKGEIIKNASQKDYESFSKMQNATPVYYVVTVYFPQPSQPTVVAAKNISHGSASQFNLSNL